MRERQRYAEMENNGRYKRNWIGRAEGEEGEKKEE
jgi:hypothetical protein